MKKNLLMGILLSIVILFTIPISFVQAADVEKIEVQNISGWNAVIEFTKAMVDQEGANTTNFFGKLKYAIFEGLVGDVIPGILETSPKIAQADVPEYMKGGLAGMAEDQVLAMFKSQPRVDVVAHLANEWVPGFEKTNSVYAAGYNDLMNAGVNSIWSVTRNIAYIGFVIVMIVIGFMIMFRNKIGGQALVTLGNSIPRVIVSLILVTFSFAITGIIIDFAGVLMTVISSTLGSGVAIYNPIELIGGFIGQNIASASQAVQGIDGLGTVGIVSGIVGALFVTGTVIGSVGIFLIILIITGIIIWGAVKLWIVLIKAYLSVLLNVIIAPVAIMFGALPGNDASISNIFKSILRNVLVFPLAYAIVNLPYFVEDHGISLVFPESFMGDGTATFGVGLGFFIQVSKIIAIYAAASSPAILMGLIPSTVSKSSADAAGAIKASLAGVPLIGGMFK